MKYWIVRVSSRQLWTSATVAQGDRHVLEHRLGELLADFLAAAQVQIAALVVADIAQEVLERGTVEAAVGALQARVALDRLGNRALRQRQAEAAGLLVDRGAIDHVLQHRPVDAAQASLLRGRTAAEAAGEIVHHRAERRLVLLDRDLGRADAGKRALAAAGEYVGDAPDDERQHEQDEQRLQNPTGGGITQGFEHGAGCPIIVMSDRAVRHKQMLRRERVAPQHISSRHAHIKVDAGTASPNGAEGCDGSSTGLTCDQRCDMNPSPLPKASPPADRAGRDQVAGASARTRF